VSAATNQAVSGVFSRLLALSFADGNSPIVLSLTEKGQAAYQRFYDVHNAEQAEMSGNEAALWSKLEGAAARLALIVHLVRCASDDASATPDAVDEASVSAGIKLADWFGAEGRRVYAMLADGDGDDGLPSELRKLMSYLEEKGGSLTVRKVTQGLSRYRGRTDLAEADLQRLVSAGRAEWQVQPASDQGGRPTRVAKLVTTGNGNETPENLDDSEGSVAVAAAEPTVGVVGDLAQAV
jgi:hypothetical protein